MLQSRQQQSRILANRRSKARVKGSPFHALWEFLTGKALENQSRVLAFACRHPKRILATGIRINVRIAQIEVPHVRRVPFETGVENAGSVVVLELGQRALHVLQELTVLTNGSSNSCVVTGFDDSVTVDVVSSIIRIISSSGGGVVGKRRHALAGDENKVNSRENGCRSFSLSLWSVRKVFDSNATFKTLHVIMNERKK